MKALLGKTVVPDDCPLTTGGVGLLGTKGSQEALEECDTLLLAGTSFPYIEFYPQPGEARAVQIDIDPARIGLRYPVEVGLVADCRRTLEALLPKLNRQENREFLEKAQAKTKDWFEIDGKSGHAHRAAHEAAGDCLGARQATVERRHRILRLGDDHHVVCPANSREGWTKTFAIRQLGQHG